MMKMHVKVENISRERAAEIMKSRGEACFFYKEKTWCGTIIGIRGDVRAKLDVPGLGKINVPYSRLNVGGGTQTSRASPVEPAPKKPSWATTPTDDENYKRSNALDIPEIPRSLLVPMQNGVKRMAGCIDDMKSRQKSIVDPSRLENDPMFIKGQECVEDEAQSLLDRLNDHYGTPQNYIDVSGKRRSTGRGELRGYYKPGSTKIRVYPYTRAKQQVVAAKTFLRTVVHEWNHHYDEKKLDLNSIHTAGFYSRTGKIYNQLKSVLD